MKRSTIATSTLALAASLVAGISAAGTITNAFENFTAGDGTTVAGLNSGASNSNLTWSVSGVVADNASIVTNNYLLLDTGDSTNTLTLADAAKVGITNSLVGGKCAYYSSKIAFVPTDSEETFAADPTLKFAIYALKANNATNLAVYHSDGEAPTTTTTDINITGGLQDVVIAVTNAAGTVKFQVTVDSQTPTAWFTACNNTPVLNAVDITGCGQLDDIAFSYEEVYAAQENITIGGDGGSSTTTHELSAGEADYLNALVAATTAGQVTTALGGLTEEKFEQAALLGLDVTATPTYHFDIKGIKRNSASSVTVTVELTRSAVIQNAIYGTLKLYGGTSPDPATYTEIASGDITPENTNFATVDTGTGTATLTFNPSGKKFFKAKIEPVPAE